MIICSGTRIWDKIGQISTNSRFQLKNDRFPVQTAFYEHGVTHKIM